MGAYADVAQLVEHHLAKVGVAGSNPVVRSRNYLRWNLYPPIAWKPQAGDGSRAVRSERTETGFPEMPGLP